jgi:hypothetical protein
MVLVATDVAARGLDIAEVLLCPLSLPFIPPPPKLWPPLPLILLSPSSSPSSSSSSASASAGRGRWRVQEATTTAPPRRAWQALTARGGRSKNSTRTKLTNRTSSASRQVKLVINFDLPTSPEDFDSYTHRIGRTGRAGNTGRAVAFYVAGFDPKTGNGRIAPQLLTLMSESGSDIPPWSPPTPLSY